MKTLKLFFALSALLIFVSCGGDSDGPTINPLVGEWSLNAIEVSDPPAGYSLDLINTEPPSTILGESNYTLTLGDDMTYTRVMAAASVFDNEGNVISADLEDDGTWVEEGEDLTLTQVNSNIQGLITEFTVKAVAETGLILETTDLWFAWPPEIASDPVALDTLDSNEDFFALFDEYGVIAPMTYTMNFQKDSPTQ